MKKKVWLFLSYVLVSALSTAATLGVVHWLGTGDSKLDQLSEIIDTFYIEEIDMTALEDAAAEAMIETCGDRWSYYIPASEYDAYLEHSENAYVGIGITITVAHDGDGLQVMEVNPGSSAEEAGILVDDVIISIEGQSASGMTTTDARNLVRGKEGTEVKLIVRRGSEEISLSVTRKTVQVPVATWEMLENNTGLITITNFDQRCAGETISAIEILRAEGAEKLIFDVRNNPGGFADELVKLLDYLLPEGDLFRSLSYDGKSEVDTSDANCLKMPMAVLINGNTYSAAEFLAAALEEYDWAVTVGEPTTGKSHFQKAFTLSDGSAVNISIGTYLTPKGVSLAEVGGLVPAVLLEVDEEMEAMIYGDLVEPREDPQVRAAIDWLLRKK